MTPLQTELNKIEQRAAAESALVMANVDKIDALYALAEQLRAHGVEVEPAVIIHLHSVEIDAVIHVRRHDEAAVESAAALLGINFSEPEGAGTNHYMTDYPVIGSGCILRFADRPFAQEAA